MVDPNILVLAMPDFDNIVDSYGLFAAIVIVGGSVVYAGLILLTRVLWRQNGKLNSRISAHQRLEKKLLAEFGEIELGADAKRRILDIINDPTID